MLIANPSGHYHFLQGIDPYSCGVVADPGWEIVHVILEQALPWRQGFDRVEAHLQKVGRDRAALCGMELRSPAPFTMDGFIAFNQQYCQVLKEWGLYLGELNPLARTNVAPIHDPPDEPVLHAFSYTVPAAPDTGKTLVVAGAGELREGVLVEKGILRTGDTSEGAMQEKAGYVMDVMAQRLFGLGGSWGLINAVDVYTIHPMEGLLEDILLSRMGPARRHGIRWYYTRPPVVDIEFEMDMRGVRRDLLI
ncbi:MAG: RidA family protein [Candidatus Latescibacteria bacterium]|nr:RidA family protein [Candidatus Latescibacterota bacterium]